MNSISAKEIFLVAERAFNDAHNLKFNSHRQMRSFDKLEPHEQVAWNKLAEWMNNEVRMAISTELS